ANSYSLHYYYNALTLNDGSQREKSLQTVAIFLFRLPLNLDKSKFKKKGNDSSHLIKICIN
ncbi:hypothetical protein ACXWOO_11595, partial [Streptococcus pyogenes]